MPQCSRSVSGLIVSLTRVLTRTSSCKRLCERTTSRGAAVPPAHSFGWREHNSIHPIGADVTPASGTWAGRSDPALPEDALMAHASSAVINTVTDRGFKRLEIAVAIIIKARTRYCAV